MISRICLLSMDKSAEMPATPPIVRKRDRGRPCKGNKNKKNRARFGNRSRVGKTHDVYGKYPGFFVACLLHCLHGCLSVGWLVVFTVAFYWYLLLSASVLFVFVSCFCFLFCFYFLFLCFFLGFLVFGSFAFVAILLALSCLPECRL